MYLKQSARTKNQRRAYTVWEGVRGRRHYPVITVLPGLSGIQALLSVMPTSRPCWKTLELLEEKRPGDPQTSGQMSSGGIPPIYPKGRVCSISRNILPFSKAQASFGLSDKSPGSVK